MSAIRTWLANRRTFSEPAIESSRAGTRCCPIGFRRSMRSVNGSTYCSKPKAGPRQLSGKMQTIKGGLQRLPDRPAAQLDVRLNSPVSAVRRTERGVEVQYQNAIGALAQEQADACVIATVFRDAVEVYPPLRGPGADLLAATKNAGCIWLRLRLAAS